MRGRKEKEDLDLLMQRAQQMTSDLSTTVNQLRSVLLELEGTVGEDQSNAI